MTLERFRLMSRALCMATAVVVCAGSATAQVMYEGQLRFGFGDGGLALDEVSPGVLEPIDTANNAIPPCAAPGAVVTPNGVGTAPPITTGGAGPQTGTIDFAGLANIAATGTAPSVMLDQAGAATTAGLNVWGLINDCPLYINLVPGGSLFRRTQMANFTWPATANAQLSDGGGPGLAGTAPNIGGRSFVNPLGQQSIRAISTGSGYGGSAAMLGGANTYLGLNGGPNGFGAGSLPIPLLFGAAAGPATPTATTGSFDVVFRTVPNTTTAPSGAPGGPFAPETNAEFAFQAFASANGFAWTTGVVTAYDKIGNFVTTRTRTGGKDFSPTGTGPTSAVIQLVSPGILRLGVGPVPLGIAITAEMDLKFVPEPASLAMFAAGIGGLGVLFIRRRRA